MTASRTSFPAGLLTTAGRKHARLNPKLLTWPERAHEFFLIAHALGLLELPFASQAMLRPLPVQPQSCWQASLLRGPRSSPGQKPLNSGRKDQTCLTSSEHKNMILLFLSWQLSSIFFPQLRQLRQCAPVPESRLRTLKPHLACPSVNV